jgi:hypothetical protein
MEKFFKKMFGYGNEAARVPEKHPELDAFIKQEETQKNLAKEAMVEKKETAVGIKDIKDVKTLAAIEFLGENSPAWAKRFGDLSSMDSKISAETLNLVKGWMSNPDNRFEDGKWISGSLEQAAEKREQVQMNIEQATADFTKKYGSKIKTWAKKGFEADMDKLVKDYMKNPSLDLVTTEDNKVAWGKPDASYTFNQ